MAVKLQYTINVSTGAPDEQFSGYGLRLNDHSGSDSCKLECSMDRMQLKLQNIESMKKTMVMHEEIFKQQVRELHRLYNLQKKLTLELYEKTRKGREKETDIIGHAYNLRDDQRELSGSCSGESSRMPLKFDLERPAEEGTPCSTQQKGETKSIDEEAEIEVELTLSIGRCTKEKKPKNRLHQYSLQLGGLDESKRSGNLMFSSSKTGGGEEYGEPSPSMSSSSATPNQANTRPHWLLQDLSLNKT